MARHEYEQLIFDDMPTSPRFPSITERARQVEYRVSSVGQISLPAPALARWDLKIDGGVVQVADLTFMTIIAPQLNVDLAPFKGTQEEMDFLLGMTFKRPNQSIDDHLEELKSFRAKLILAACSNTITGDPVQFTIRPYKVSSVGQITLPAQIRQRWGMPPSGGKIDMADLGSFLAVMPKGGRKVLTAYFLAGIPKT